MEGERKWCHFGERGCGEAHDRTLCLFDAYVSFHASGSNTEDYLAHVPFRSSDQWGACVDHRLATTDATNSLTIDGDTVMGAQSQKYYVCLTWIHFKGGPEVTCPWGSASTADWREESRWWARGSAQDQCHRRLSHCLQGFCAQKSEIIHQTQKYEGFIFVIKTFSVSNKCVKVSKYGISPLYKQSKISNFFCNVIFFLYFYLVLFGSECFCLCCLDCDKVKKQTNTCLLW